MDQDRNTLISNSGDSSSGYDSVANIQESIRTLPGDSPRRLPQYIAGLAATLSALSAGVILGWTSPILSELQDGDYQNITVDNNEMGWIGSFVTLGAMFICIPTGFLCNLIGTKFTLILLMIPFTFGWLLILFAKSVLMLYFGRFICGIATGGCCVAAPLYCSEISSMNIRGQLGSFFQLMITIGILLAYIFGKFLSPMNYTIICSTFPLIFFFTFIFQPQTPVYYLRNNSYDLSFKTLEYLRGYEHDNQTEMMAIENTLKENSQVKLSINNLFSKRSFRRALLVAFGLMFFQQFSGINAIILYTSDIFKSSNIKLDPKTATIIIGAFQTISTFSSSLIIDRLGRRILLMISSIIMSLSTCLLAFYFTLKYRIDDNHTIINELNFLPILALCLFIIVFSIGLGPIPWMISSEIFTNDIKNIASSCVGTFNWFLAFLITKFYLQINDCVGQDVTFYFFTSISLIGAIFTYFVVPETKGKSIEQVQEELEN